MILVLVVQTLDSTIHWIKIYPADTAIGFPNTYLQDSDVSSGQHYPMFEQQGPDHLFKAILTIQATIIIIHVEILQTDLHTVP